MTLAAATRSLRVGGVELAYLEDGEAGDPLVVCLHGFPDSPVTFRHLAADLVGRGYRVVRPWLRGYPPSEATGPYQSAALARDAIGLAEALAPGEPAYLVGHDWGGVTAYAAGVLAPERWHRIVVLSVPPSRVFRAFLASSWEQQRAAWYQFLFQLEPLAENVVGADDYDFLDRLWRAWSPEWELDREALAAAKETIHAGFPAALAMYRDAWQPARQAPELVDDQVRIVAGPLTVPVLVLHGLADGCVLPAAYADAAIYFAGPHRVEGVPGLGHFLHLEDPAPINESIARFLAEDAALDGGGLKEA